MLTGGFHSEQATVAQCHTHQLSPLHNHLRKIAQATARAALDHSPCSFTAKPPRPRPLCSHYQPFFLRFCLNTRSPMGSLQPLNSASGLRPLSSPVFREHGSLHMLHMRRGVFILLERIFPERGAFSNRPNVGHGQTLAAAYSLENLVNTSCCAALAFHPLRDAILDDDQPARPGLVACNSIANNI